MNPQTDLEIKGSFFEHPCAELMAEIGQARLSGSLRLSDKDKKSILYFKSGKVVFAVSNARTARLFDILLRRNKLTKEDLGQIPEFANDLQFAAYLEGKGFLTKPECDQLFAEQIEGIIIDILAWPSGEWTFSSLARIRDGLAFDIDSTRLLLDYGRCVPVEAMLGRFRSLDENFSRSSLPELSFVLKPEEAFVLSRTNEGYLSASGLVGVAAMSEATALHLIYTLWLGGLLTRNNWQAAFSAETVAAMRNAKLELKTEATLRSIAIPGPVENVEETPREIPVKDPEVVITLDEYLERVDNAETHYDILGVDAKASVDELKQAYFGMAKMFHPDKYHATGGPVLARVQNAFTELARAHETLKTPESREVYDYRMRKELADREKRRAAGNGGGADLQTEQAEENFERGFSLLMDDEFEAALPFLARAAHFAPKNARYRAYYGKALSIDSNQRHKAESEMQAALKLDPNNPTFRILLAEFFIQHNLMKRAEGELNRLLAVFPSNREAHDLLARMKD